MTSRKAPSQRNPEYAVARMSRALQSMSPGSMGGRVANASPVSVRASANVGLITGGGPSDGGGSGGGAAVRADATYATGALAAGEAEKGRITMSTYYSVVYIRTNAAARVRLYVSTGDQNGDYGRPITYDPAPGLGIVMDFLTDASLLQAPLTPIPEGVTFDSTLGSGVPITVTSVDGGPVTVTLTWINQE